MSNCIINKAANCARENVAGGFEVQKAIGIASASCGCTAYEVAHELQRRSREQRARNKRKQQMIDGYWSRYEN